MNVGYLSVPEFRSVLKLANVMLDEDEVYHVLNQFDNDMSGKISYDKFIDETLKPPTRHSVRKLWNWQTFWFNYCMYFWSKNFHIVLSVLNQWTVYFCRRLNWIKTTSQNSIYGKLNLIMEKFWTEILRNWKLFVIFWLRLFLYFVNFVLLLLKSRFLIELFL